RHNAKVIFAGRDICVVSHAPRARLSPVLIEAFEHITELYFIWGDEAWSRELKLQLSFPWRQHQILIERQIFVVNENAFQHNRRWELIFNQVRWIDDRKTSH